MVFCLDNERRIHLSLYAVAYVTSSEMQADISSEVHFVPIAQSNIDACRNDTARKKVFEQAIRNGLYDHNQPPRDTHPCTRGLYTLVMTKGRFGESLCVTEDVNSLRADQKRDLFLQCMDIGISRKSAIYNTFNPSCDPQDVHKTAVITVPSIPNKTFRLRMTLHDETLGVERWETDECANCHRNFTLMTTDES